MKGIKGFQKGHEVSEETRKKIGDALRNQVYSTCDYCKKPISNRPSQWYNAKTHEWENFGNYYDSIQYITRYWTKKQAVDFVGFYFTAKYPPIRMQFIVESHKVWE